jgi:excinuclease ABC subunit A
MDRFKEHTIELPVGSLVVSADNEAELRACSAARWNWAGVLHLLHPLDGLEAAMDGRRHRRRHRPGEGVLHQARLPGQCGTSYPELDPRMFSYNSKHGWCTGCVGTGLTLTREQRKAYDDRARRRQQGPRTELPGRRGRGRRPGRRALHRLRRRAPERPRAA